jgi:hypothetical protein
MENLEELTRETHEKHEKKGSEPIFPLLFFGCFVVDPTPLVYYWRQRGGRKDGV